MRYRNERGMAGGAYKLECAARLRTFIACVVHFGVRERKDEEKNRPQLVMCTKIAAK